MYALNSCAGTILLRVLRRLLLWRVASFLIRRKWTTLIFVRLTRTKPSIFQLGTPQDYFCFLPAGLGSELDFLIVSTTVVEGLFFAAATETNLPEMALRTIFCRFRLSGGGWPGPFLLLTTRLPYVAILAKDQASSCDHTCGVRLNCETRYGTKKEPTPKVSPLSQVPVTSSALLEPIAEWGA